MLYHDRLGRTTLRRMTKIERTFPARTVEGEENYRAIFENAVAGIYQTTLDGRFVKANAAMARLLLYDSPEDLVSTVTDVGKQLYVDSEQRRKLMSELEASQVLSGVECQFYRKDGSTTWVRLDARIVRDVAGKSSYCEGIIEDISSYKESEQKLADQARELAAANESLKAEVVERKRAEQVSRGQADALVKSLDRLAAEPELDEFIGLVLQVIAEQLQASSAALWLFDQDSQEVWMHLDYTEGRVRKPEHTDHPHASGRVSVRELPWWPFDLSVDKPAPLVFGDVSRDPGLREWGEKQGIKSWLSAPMVFGSRTVGFLTIRSSQPNRFGEEAEQLAGALANQVTLAVEMARLAAKRQQTAILEERNRIAREIHDTLAQSLSGVVVQLEAAQEVLKDAPEECGQHIARAADQARTGLTEARRSVWALRPESPQRRNIVDAVEGLVRESSVRTETDVACSSDGEIQSVSPEVEYNLLRVAREALNNAIRHAGPCKLALHLVFENHHVRLSITDDGCGFVPDEVAGDGFGLIGMRERIERVDGELRIDSRPGAGTRVDVRVPCEA